MKYYLKIFGCQMNYSDAERIATILEKLGLKPAFKNTANSSAEALAKADLIVFVTCGVRQSAENRVYGLVSNLRKKYPKKKIILTGCLAHRKDVQRRLKDKVDLFATIKDFSKKIKKISRHSGTPPRRWLDTKYQILNTDAKLCNDYLQLTPKYTSSHTAYIPVMTGCNNFCSYCVVPYARGREYSRPAEDILSEVLNLTKDGCREIILLGQNVNSYRSKFQILNFKFKIKSKLPITNSKLRKFIDFSDLLKLLDAVPGHFWISFLTSHPKDMSDELIKTIAKSKKICEYISLPAQSGDNEILKKMNRHYTVARYKNLIKKIRKAFFRQEPGSCRLPSISTDIIVGFPRETRKQFENTAKLFREMKFDMGYINQYSPRPETAAWKFKDNVSKKEKSRRERVLTEILKYTALENNKKHIGKIVDVLVDTSSQPSPYKGEGGGDFPLLNKERVRVRLYSGHARTQKKVIFSSNKKIPIGSFVKVKITKAKAFGLEGNIK